MPLYRRIDCQTHPLTVAIGIATAAKTDSLQPNLRLRPARVRSPRAHAALLPQPARGVARVGSPNISLAGYRLCQASLGICSIFLTQTIKKQMAGRKLLRRNPESSGLKPFGPEG